MAGHVNGALGLKVAHPERTVVVGCGDGCYLLSGFELMTAVQYQIPVIWIVFDDEEFKLIKLYQLEAYHETGLVEFHNPDFAAYARACGADGYRVDTLEDFEEAFARRARLGPADRHRRQDHPLGGAALQPVSRRRDRRARRGHRGPVPVPLTVAITPRRAHEHGTSEGGQHAGPMGRDHGRGQPRGRASRVRQAGPRHHARPAEEREDGQRARSPAPGRPRVPRQVHPRHRPGRADLPGPARRPRAGFAQPGRTYPAIAPVLQRGRHRPARHQAGPARGGAARPGVARGVARPADDQLPGLPRAQRPPVRRVRQGDRRRPVSHGCSGCSG